MSIKVIPNKVYHCVNPTITTASVEIKSGGSYNIKVSNCTELDPDTKKIIVPPSSELIPTDDEALEQGKLYLLSNTSEWIMFEGDASGEIWCKCLIDPRIEPGD